MTAVIQADSFIETKGCDGPRYNRNSPSRETPGILMSDIQDKYTAEFELPFLNVERYIKEVGNNWNRLDNKQRESIKQSFKSMGINNKEKFGDVTTGATATGATTVDPNVTNFINFLSTNASASSIAPDNTYMFMDTLWNTTPDQMTQMGLTQDQLSQIRDSMYQWSVDNTYAFHTNWRSGLLFSFFLLLIIILIIVAATANDNTPKTTQFGKSLFGRRYG